MKKNITKILLIIVVITVCIGAKVYADYIMNATDVEYTKSDSTKVSVKAALDDLYTKSQQMVQIQNIDIDDLNSLGVSNTAVGLSYNGSQNITITNPNNYYISVDTSDSTIATVTKNSNTEITINALSKNGNANINVRVQGVKVKEIGVGVWSGSGIMSVATAKAIINESNISAFQGTQVDYNPTGGGTWRIFYYDETGKYGDGAGTLYIKRDYKSSTTVSDESYRTYYTNSANQSAVLADMRKI